MSRLGKKPIQIPAKVEIACKDGVVTVKGPKGTLSRPMPPTTAFTIEGSTLRVQSDGSHSNAKAFHGLARALIQNLLTGVSEGFSKELALVGVGFRGEVKGKVLNLSLGFSHPVEMPIPEGLKVEIIGNKKDEILITGIDRDLLGEFTANVRSKRPPEPYKGKGVRYKDERVKLKAGKRVGA
jgi:large subunit ribosomal protein L6